MAIKKIERTEINNLLNIESIKNTSNITITNEEEPVFGISFYFDDIFDEKKVKEFIKAVEKNVRRSSYYSNYIGELNESGITNCALLGNVSKDLATVEFHHFPFTLYDIVMIHLTKNLAQEIKMSSFSVAKEVIQDHYDNIVPLVPLSKTAHQLVHTGDAAVSIKQVFGDIQGFVDKYRDYMSDDLIIKYNKMVEYSEESDKIYASNTILDTCKINVDNEMNIDEIDF